MNQPLMKYAILGDIHANLEALAAVLKDAQDQHCTHFACVGDIVGYNANPGECIEMIRSIGMPCVKGNHDEYSSNDLAPRNFNPRAAAAVCWTRHQLSAEDKQWLRELKHVRIAGNFTLVHATLDAPDRWGYVFDPLTAAASFTYQNTAVCFFGHTHCPRVFIRGSRVRAEPFSKIKLEPGCKYLVNVGSVGEPRDGNPDAAYAVYDLASGSIELRRVASDLDLTEAKVRAAGLPLRRKQ
jgi:predicted phosphodiesterase